MAVDGFCSMHGTTAVDGRGRTWPAVDGRGRPWTALVGGRGRPWRAVEGRGGGDAVVTAE